MIAVAAGLKCRMLSRDRRGSCPELPDRVLPALGAKRRPHWLELQPRRQTRARANACREILPSSKMRQAHADATHVQALELAAD